MAAGSSRPSTTTTTCCRRTSSTRSSARSTTLTEERSDNGGADDEVCEECGFDYAGHPDDAEVIDAMRSFGRRYRIPLSRGLPGEDLGELVRLHPIEGGWSALEYTCHVRDVLRTQRERVDQTIAEDRPEYTPMGREARVVDDRYNEQDPATVAGELEAAAEAFADRLAALGADEWERTGIYGYPVRAERSLQWLARHTMHEGHHHLLDVGRTLRAARGR